MVEPARIDEFQQRLSRFQVEANKLLAADKRGKLTTAQKADADRLITNLAALTREIKRVTPSEPRTVTPASHNVAESPVRWSNQPLVAIRTPFMFNRNQE